MGSESNDSSHLEGLNGSDDNNFYINIDNLNKYNQMLIKKQRTFFNKNSHGSSVNGVTI